MMMFFLWFRPLSNPAWYGLIVTIHIHDSIYSKKKWPLNENTVICSEMCSNYLSNEKFCVKFGRFFAETLQSEYQEI